MMINGEFTNGGQIPAYGNEKTNEQLIIELGQENRNLRRSLNKLIENENQPSYLSAVSTRLFGVYDRNGNIKSVYREPYNAFEEAIKLNIQLAKDEYFIDWVIVG